MLYLKSTDGTWITIKKILYIYIIFFSIKTNLTFIYNSLIILLFRVVAKIIKIRKNTHNEIKYKTHIQKKYENHSKMFYETNKHKLKIFEIRFLTFTVFTRK